MRKQQSETMISDGSTNGGGSKISPTDELAVSLAPNQRRGSYRASSNRPSPSSNTPPEATTPKSSNDGNGDDNNKEDTAREEWVDSMLEEMQDESVFCLENEPRPIPYFLKDEVEIGRFLGNGEFGSVHAVSAFHTNDEHAPNHDHTAEEADGHESPGHSEHDEEEQILLQNRQFMIRAPTRDGKERYATKQILKEMSARHKDDAILDLAFEAAYLSRIKHPNIVRLRATVGLPGSPSFTLIMDRLEETLSQKIDHWQDQHKEQFKRTALIFQKKDKMGLAALFEERLLAVYDVARAMRYLHSLNLLFRDLKSDNIGVDSRGDYKIFDFGLCKELKDKDLVQRPDSYQASAMTGSRRYMAPEVALGKPYGFKADVYSFGILFWQVFALKTPFADMTASKHTAKVVVGGLRPPAIQKALSEGSTKRAQGQTLHKLMQTCWDEDPAERPTFEELCKGLEKGLQDDTSQPLDRSFKLTNLSHHSKLQATQ